MQMYDEGVHSALVKGLLLPLCEHIETDLRLHHHSAALVGVTPLNPLTTPLLDVSCLLEVERLQLATRSLDIRHAFTHSSVPHTARRFRPLPIGLPLSHRLL